MGCDGLGEAEDAIDIKDLKAIVTSLVECECQEFPAGREGNVVAGPTRSGG